MRATPRVLPREQWHVTWVIKPHALDGMLEDGWEPFAVTYDGKQHIWHLRRWESA